MPTFRMEYNLNDSNDVDALALKLERLANSLREDKMGAAKYDDNEESIDLSELCKRLKRKPPTIAVFRLQGMPYIAGKPCTYIYKDCYEWMQDGYSGDADPLIPVKLTPQMGHGSGNTMS